MHPDIQAKYDRYPSEIKPRMTELRTLVFEVARSLGLADVEENLKWGEPSYLVKGGSAIRMDWKAKSPERYSLYFNCKTTLIDTYRELYSDTLHFQGNREIVLNVNEPLPEDIIRHCIQLAFTYKSVKHLPLLGA